MLFDGRDVTSCPVGVRARSGLLRSYQITSIFEEFADGKPVTKDWPRIPYDTAIRKYGSDKPDLRNPIEMQAVTEHFAGSGFKVFAGQIEADPKVEVWAIPAKNKAGAEPIGRASGCRSRCSARWRVSRAGRAASARAPAIDAIAVRVVR